MRRRLRERTGTVLLWICGVLTVLLVLLTTAFLASPIRYAPPQELALAAA